MKVEDCEVVCKRCVELESEVVKRKSEYEALDAKFRALEVEKVKMDEEIKVLKREKGAGRVVDLNEDNGEEDSVFEVMIENKVLECEKKKAENEVEAWKEKFKRLESWVLKLAESLVLKGGELPLAERMKAAGLGSPNVGSLEGRQIIQLDKRGELEDGLHVESGLGSSRDKDVAVDVGKGICDLQSAGTPSRGTPCKNRDGIKEKRVESGVEYANSGQARKQLKFEEEGSPCRKMAPATPSGGVPSSVGVINISDSDDELKITPPQTLLPTDNQVRRKVCISSGSVLGETVGSEKKTTNNYKKKTHTDHNVGEDADENNESLVLALTPKRKRASNIVTSDSESSDDDNPIGKLKKLQHQEIMHDKVGSDLKGSSATATASVVGNETGTVTPPRRRLVRLRKCGESDGARKKEQGILTNEDVEDAELEDVGSESEGESLGGFIVNSSDSEGNDASEGDDTSEDNDASTKSEDLSDDNVTFEEDLSKFQRNKDHKKKWEYEADMLSAFGKDPELCMKAVCALYRQQTCEEQFSRGSLCYNHRGFSKFDALRGSRLAEFLTAGDQNGDLTKTVEELEAYDPSGIETYRTFASRYSKQLFEIYKSKEDPLFLP